MLLASLASLSIPQKARLQSLEASLGVSRVKDVCFLLELFLEWQHQVCLLPPLFWTPASSNLGHELESSRREGVTVNKPYFFPTFAATISVALIPTSLPLLLPSLLSLLAQTLPRTFTLTNISTPKVKGTIYERRT